MEQKTRRKLALSLSMSSSPHDINIVLAILSLTQETLAKRLEVTQAAISYAINNDPLMNKLRIRIIDYLNLLQFKKEVA